MKKLLMAFILLLQTSAFASYTPGGSGGASSLTGLSDVGSASVTVGSILVADGTKYQSNRTTMTVRTDTGNVGIGSTAPADVLQINTGSTGGQIINAVSSGLDSQTVLMLHADGTNGSTSFIDSSASAHTMTAVGNAQLSTAQKQFGTASALGDGTGDDVTTPNSSDFDFGAGNWTIDFWFRSTNGAAYTGVYEKYVDANNYMGIYINPIDSGGSQGVIVFDAVVGGVDKAHVLGNSDSGINMDANIWYHVAIVRNSTTMLFFINGVSSTTNVLTSPSTNNLNVGTATQVFYASPNFGGVSFTGTIDEYRVSKGIARWTSNFTPPTSPYGSGTMSHILFQENGTGQWAIGNDGTDNEKLKIGTTEITTGTKLTMNTDGNVGIGYTAPSDKLVVNGNVGIGKSVTTQKLDVSGTVAATSFTSASDIYDVGPTQAKALCVNANNKIAVCSSVVGITGGCTCN